MSVNSSIGRNKAPRPLVILDLGRVLVDTNSPARSMGLAVSEKDFWDIWTTSDSVFEFETGTLTLSEFAAQFASDVGLGAEEFLARFENWRLAPYPGAERVLEELAKSSRIAVLSNMNEPVWSRLLQDFAALESIDDIFLSCRIKHGKPDPLSFEHVLDSTGFNPDEAFFFDDSPANVSAANRLGIRGFEAIGLGQLKSHLLEHGLI